jgi:hypothetical protein
MMIEEWRRFKGWSVLEFFLQKNEKIHLKGLARRLNISPRTAQTYLYLYEKEGILYNEHIGNMKLYGLTDNFIAKELKRAYMLFLIKERIYSFIQNNKNITSLALYGSCADGSYDDKSDIDLIVISQKKDVNINALKQLEGDITREVKIEVFSIGEWRKMEKSDFYISVTRNNILIYGASL